jgi:hypothetical protein
MKIAKINGAASQAAKTSPTVPSDDEARKISLLDTRRGGGEKLDAWDVEREANRKAAGEKRDAATKTITITISADIYGFLCAAGVIHDGTPEQVAAAFLEEHVPEWTNFDFILEDYL